MFAGAAMGGGHYLRPEKSPHQFRKLSRPIPGAQPTARGTARLHHDAIKCDFYA